MYNRLMHCNVMLKWIKLDWSKKHAESSIVLLLWHTDCFGEEHTSREIKALVVALQMRTSLLLQGMFQCQLDA